MQQGVQAGNESFHCSRHSALIHSARTASDPIHFIITKFRGMLFSFNLGCFHFKWNLLITTSTKFSQVATVSYCKNNVIIKAASSIEQALAPRRPSEPAAARPRHAPPAAQSTLRPKLSVCLLFSPAVRPEHICTHCLTAKMRQSSSVKTVLYSTMT